MKIMITYKMDTENVDWLEVHDILHEAGLSDFSPEEQEVIFTHSTITVFAMNGAKIVGVARALSDTLSQGAIFNVAVRPAYQGLGVGTNMISRVLEKLKGQNVVIYTSPAGVSFYERFGFRRCKTSMCLFAGAPEHLQMLENGGFMLPEGFRFDGEPSRKV